MARTETPVCDFDLPAPEFRLPGTDGKTYGLQDVRGPNGLLVMFICNHCPYVKAVRERIVRDVNELRQYGINAVAISPNDPTDYPEDSFENMKKIAVEWKLPMPYLFDESQQAAKNFGAVCTPDFFGYNKDLKLQYRGRHDESRKKDEHRPFWRSGGRRAFRRPARDCVSPLRVAQQSRSCLVNPGRKPTGMPV